MAQPETSDAVARCLGELWMRYQSIEFGPYLQQTYGIAVDPLPTFECLYIAEVVQGDFASGSLGSIVKQWWSVDQSGIKLVANPRIQGRDTEETFFERPWIKFFLDGDRVVLGERLGPDLMSRRLARLTYQDGKATLSETSILEAVGDPHGR